MAKCVRRKCVSRNCVDHLDLGVYRAKSSHAVNIAELYCVALGSGAAQDAVCEASAAMDGGAKNKKRKLSLNRSHTAVSRCATDTTDTMNTSRQRGRPTPGADGLGMLPAVTQGVCVGLGSKDAKRERQEPADWSFNTFNSVDQKRVQMQELEYTQPGQAVVLVGLVLLSYNL